jgi:Flp pilus assembly protein TadB
MAQNQADFDLIMYLSVMLFNRFFKQPKPNKFGYTPVFYDERKIERERKIKEAKLKEDERLRKDSFDFKSKYAKEIELKRNQSLDKFRTAGNAKSNRMLLIILIMIFGIIYVQFTL